MFAILRYLPAVAFPVVIGPAVVWQPMLEPAQIAFMVAMLTVLSVWSYVRSSQDTPVFTHIRRLKTQASRRIQAHVKRHPMIPWSRLLLLMMRLGGIAAVGVVLMGPSQLPVTSDNTQPMSVTFLLDMSASMATADCHGQARWRYARDRWLSPTALRGFAVNTYIDLNGFAEEIFPLNETDPQKRDVPARAGVLSYIGRCTREAVQNHSQRRDGVVVVLSDGHDSEDLEPAAIAAFARARKVPIYAAAFGGTTNQQDITLTAVPMQESFLPNEPGAILVKVRQAGLPNAKTVVHLRGEDREQTQTVDFQGRDWVEIQFEVRQTSKGQYEYQVAVDPLPEEHELKNNQQSVFCQVDERRIRVLLLEGQPFWDTKFLAQSLRKDERIELTQLTQVTPDNRETIVSRAEGTAVELPTNAEAWTQYDLVILGRDLEKLLNTETAAMLRDFVIDRGGHLLFAREQPYDTMTVAGRTLQQVLSPVEPVEWEEGRTDRAEVRLLQGNLKSSWFAAEKLGTKPQEVFAELPALHSMQRVTAAKPATIVYADALPRDGAGRGMPLLVSMRAGRGQVAAVLGQGTWQWSLLPASNEAVVSFYDTFWSNLTRWLVQGGDFQPGEQASLHLSRQSVRLDDEMTIELDLKQATPVGQSPQLLWRTPTGETTELALQALPGRSPRFRTRVRPSVIGVHQIEAITPGLMPHQQIKRFNVYDINLERLETSARPNYLQTLAESSGGQLLDPENPESLLDQLRRRQLIRQIPAEPTPIWDRWTWMTLLLSWMGAEWLFRRAAGLW